MLLSEVFLPEFIKYDLKGITKNEIFEEMVDHFCHITRKNVKKDVLAALYERESLMSTGVLHGIAMPHGKTAAIDGIFGVLGVSRHGISYDSMDGRPVYLVFMLIAPPVKAETHLHILQLVAKFMRKPSFYNGMINAQNEKEVYDVIKSYEDQFLHCA
ncbi:MAG: PTS sugar transporter subunit IIA [Spirochaetaceae bacterium]|jgi:PTS system fructose-specific IIC component/PTS system nitrogen regulatory IIA component|nr:PTS sugar transporter subunit IIA [Spirochaetaceae bacterium]